MNLKKERSEKNNSKFSICIWNDFCAGGFRNIAKIRIDERIFFNFDIDFVEYTKENTLVLNCFDVSNFELVSENLASIFEE